MKCLAGFQVIFLREAKVDKHGYASFVKENIGRSIGTILLVPSNAELC